ncbi:MAG: efflux RND transporter permease subunit [Planctomycetota bacterium]|nr:efflux RND transporter permease subunit [Planctomycetota bacterium]
MTSKDDQTPRKDAASEDKVGDKQAEARPTEDASSGVDGGGKSDNSSSELSQTEESKTEPTLGSEKSSGTSGEDSMPTETAADLIPDNKQASWLVRISIKNPFLVIVLCLLICVLGYVTIGKIPVDILPSFKTPAVQVLTLYPGMPTEIMERDITSRLERWTSQSEGIERQESRSMMGVSIVKDYFRDDIDPNTAFSQVTSYAMSDMYYLPPGTVPPMVMLFDPSAPLPTALLAASSDVLDEKESYDLAYYNVRNMLSGSPGVIAPAVFGGKLRRIYIYLDPQKLENYGLSLMDVQQAIKKNNLMIPTGTAKIGDTDYMVDMANMIEDVPSFDDIVVKVIDGRPIYVRDVGHVEDASAIQTNIVRISRAPNFKSQRQVYVPIFRRPGANTIDVVNGVRERIPEFLGRLPPKEGYTDPDTGEPASGLNLDVVADQSVYVRKAISNLTKEGILGAVLASLMVLLFIGSFRSTLIIALAIPLSALVAIIGLYFTGNTLNAMTLGGLALVMGRLVDDPLIDIENTFRHLDMGKSPVRAALDSATEIAMPVLVATITTCVVFFPVVFLFGIGKFLFTPMAVSVTIAMFASYFLSRTLSPAFCAYFLKAHKPDEKKFFLFAATDSAYEAVREIYVGLLRVTVRLRWLTVAAALILVVASLPLYSFIGKELFPATDAAQILINVRAASGTRIEATEEITQAVEQEIFGVIPAEDRQMVVTDIGVLYDWPAGYTPNAGPMDATMLCQLTEADQRHVTTQEYAERLRARLNEKFPDISFAFNTGGMVQAALNFGLPSPIDIQISGRNMEEQTRIAAELRDLIAEKVPGAVDVRVQQPIDYPTLKINPNRTKMALSGISQEDATKNLMSMLNSSTSFDPSFWLDHKSGNHYFVGVTYEEDDIDSFESIRTVPITGEHSSFPIQLQNLVDEPTVGESAVEVAHLALGRVVDIYANVEGRDIGAVSDDIERVMTEWAIRKDPQAGSTISNVSWVPRDEEGDAMSGYSITMRGEVGIMKESFSSLAYGMILAVTLIYLIMVAQFRSFLDPFIIMFAVPLGVIGVLGILWLTNTTFNIQSLMGGVFMIGIAVTNSILLVEFANRLREEGRTTQEAAIEAGSVRLRPIMMTALAMVFGLIPLALHEGDPTMPLARAVIGGLTASTLLTIFVVPCLYVMFKGANTRGVQQT